MIFLVFLLFLFVFFFCLYMLSKDDLVLLRKNVTIEDMFNYAFIILAISILFARVFYVIFHFKSIYLNPLVFLYFTKYPGFSLTGGLLAGVISLYFYLAQRKTSVHRIFDIFALSFLSSLPFTFIPYFFVHTNLILYILIFVFPLLYILLFILFVRMFINSRAKEGSTGLLVLVLYSLLTISWNILYGKEHIIFFFSKEDFLLLGMFFITFVLYIQKELTQRKSSY